MHNRKAPEPFLSKINDAQDEIYKAQRHYDNARVDLDIAVLEAVAAGVSWQTIGNTLGITKVTAWQRFAKVDPPRPKLPLNQAKIREIESNAALALAEAWRSDR